MIPQLILLIVFILFTLLILWVLIRGAIVSAMRQARHEARVERTQPDKAKWLYGEAQSLALKGQVHGTYMNIVSGKESQP